MEKIGGWGRRPVRERQNIEKLTIPVRADAGRNGGKNRNTMRIFLPFIFLLTLPNMAQSDSLILDESTFWWLVLNNHPVVKQADLWEEKGRLEIKKAKGNFDPILAVDHVAKTFEEKNYFGLIEGGLVIPTTYGVEVKANYSNNDGLFLNPENKVPENGLWSVGVAIPIGQGLLFDERRATLQKAEVFANSTSIQRQIQVNDLLYEALMAYYNWVTAWEQRAAYQQAIGLAEERLQGIRQRFIGGDLPAIDTLEAFVQLQNRKIAFQDYELNVNNARLNVSNFLWTTEQMPLLISDELQPAKTNGLQIDQLDSIFGETIMVDNNLALALYDLKLQDLTIEQRWKKEKLKPKAKVVYNFLNGTEQVNLFNNNYKWGIEFSMPLFLRTARNDLKLGRVKIQETTFEQQVKRQELQNKSNALLNKLRTIDLQIQLLNGNLVDYRRLLEAEQIKFQIGESSVFLLNSREVKLIDMELKLIETVQKRRLTYLEYRWLAIELEELVF